jgi:tetratricopeptide (TPR) repeat protein
MQNNKRDILAAFILSVLVFLLYLAAICPTIYWRDGPEFSDIGYMLGISHPTGSPAYSLITRLFTMIPAGSIALKVNLASSVFGAAAFGMLFMLSSYLVRRLAGSQSMPVTAAFTLFFALSSSLWTTSVVAEVYAMKIFLELCILYLFVRWSFEKKSGLLYSAVFLYGICSGVHGVVGLYLPAVIIFILMNDRRMAFSKAGLLCAATFLAGFSVYLYLPVRAGTHPSFNVGDTEKIENLITHLMVKKDTSSIVRLSRGSFWNDTVFFYLKLLNDELTVWPVLFAIPGFIHHFRKDRRTWLLLFLFCFINTGFFIRFWGSGVAYLPTFAILCLWAAMGFGRAVERLKGLKAFADPGRTLAAITAAFLVFSLFDNYADADRSNYYTADETYRDNYGIFVKDSVVVSTIFWFSFRYMQDIERRREDVDIILYSMILKPEYWVQVSKQSFPRLNLPDYESTSKNWAKFAIDMINLNIEDRAVYIEPNRYSDLYLYDNLVPRRFYFRVSQEKSVEIDQKATEEYMADLKKMLSKQVEEPEYFADRDLMKNFYPPLLGSMAQYFMVKGRPSASLYLLTLLKTLMAEGEFKMGSEIGRCYALMGDYAKAEEIFLKQLKDNPDEVENIFLLARLYSEKGDEARAGEMNDRLLKSPNLEERAWGFYSMGMTELNKGKLEDARRHLRAAESMTDERVVILNIRRLLSIIESGTGAKVKF